MEPKLQWLNQSPNSPLHHVLRRLDLVASSPIPILLSGETGIGKDVFARTLHELSNRKSAPFVPVNCGALSPALLESTLFGAIRGAFTGAHQNVLGLVRAAHSGTLFLDEIGELPLDAQSRLLRVLQERAVVPVGGHSEIAVDFRLVCATHRDLSQAVAHGTFREDLFFRINAFPLQIPPLRARPQDLLPLAAQIWRELDADCELREALSSKESQALMCYAWPGNVRQLKNVLQRFSIMRHEGVEFEDLLKTEPLCVAEPTPTYHATHVRATRERPSPNEIHATIARMNHNKCHAARELGISRGSLCYQLRKLGL